MNTYAALIKTMKMYQNEPTIFHPKEFVAFANYYHYYMNSVWKWILGTA
jgi:hypothetical protein